MSSNAVSGAVVRMGNDIARNFAHLDPDRRIAEISAHLDRFWGPGLKDELRRSVASGDVQVDTAVVAVVAAWDRSDPAV